MAVLEIAPELVDEMIAHAREDAPNECCGILIGRDGAAIATRRVTNRVDEKNKPFRYEMEPREYMAVEEECSANGWTLWGFYHSHTRSPAYPSQTDRNLAFWPGTKELIWPNSYYLLVSLENEDAPVVRAFSITDDDVWEYDLRVTGTPAPDPAG